MKAVITRLSHGVIFNQPAIIIGKKLIADAEHGKKLLAAENWQEILVVYLKYAQSINVEVEVVDAEKLEVPAA